MWLTKSSNTFSALIFSKKMVIENLVAKSFSFSMPPYWLTISFIYSFSRNFCLCGIKVSGGCFYYKIQYYWNQKLVIRVLAILFSDFKFALNQAPFFVFSLLSTYLSALYAFLYNFFLGYWTLWLLPHWISFLLLFLFHCKLSVVSYHKKVIIFLVQGLQRS